MIGQNRLATTIAASTNIRRTAVVDDAVDAFYRSSRTTAEWIATRKVAFERVLRNNGRKSMILHRTGSKEEEPQGRQAQQVVIKSAGPQVTPPQYPSSPQQSNSSNGDKHWNNREMNSN